MARYIDADALISVLEAKADMAMGTPKAVFLSVAKMVDYLPPADVAPKSEAEQWYHEYHAIKDELKQEKMYHRETEKLADRYCAELQTAKSEVAKEIFAEIENLFAVENFRLICNRQAFAELKKKYTEGKHDAC